MRMCVYLQERQGSVNRSIHPRCYFGANDWSSAGICGATCETYTINISATYTNMQVRCCARINILKILGGGGAGIIGAKKNKIRPEWRRPSDDEDGDSFQQRLPGPDKDT